MTEPDSDKPVDAPDHRDGLQPGWHQALPEKVPRRTYTPAVLAAGLVLLFWGFVTSPILSGAGIGLLGFGVAGWIEELQFERR